MSETVPDPKLTVRLSEDAAKAALEHAEDNLGTCPCGQSSPCGFCCRDKEVADALRTALSQAPGGEEEQWRCEGNGCRFVPDGSEEGGWEECKGCPGCASGAPLDEVAGSVVQAARDWLAAEFNGERPYVAADEAPQRLHDALVALDAEIARIDANAAATPSGGDGEEER